MSKHEGGSKKEKVGRGEENKARDVVDQGPVCLDPLFFSFWLCSALLGSVLSSLLGEDLFLFRFSMHVDMQIEAAGWESCYIHISPPVPSHLFVCGRHNTEEEGDLARLRQARDGLLLTWVKFAHVASVHTSTGWSEGRQPTAVPDFHTSISSLSREVANTDQVWSLVGQTDGGEYLASSR